MGHCRYCGHRAGWFRSSHRQCAATYRQGLAQLVDLVAVASVRPDFTQRRMLRILDGLAQQCYVPAEYLPAVLAAGWHLSDLNRTVDRVPTRAETDWLRELRQGQLATAAAQAHEEPALLTAAVAAALATSNQPPRLERLSRLLERSGVTDVAGRTLLLRAWERAVARQLDDRTRRPPCCTTPGISTWTTASWTATGCCASSFRVRPLPKRRPVWCPSA